MKLRDLLEKWGLTSLAIKAPFLEAEWEPRDADMTAAWELYVELITRVATQHLDPDEGDEAAALESRPEAAWRIEVPPASHVSADREQLDRVLVNLGRNAFQAGADHVTVSARTEPGRMTVLIADDGQGMTGSVLIIDFANRREAEDFCAADPYARAGLFQSVTIQPWRQVYPKAGV